MGLQVEEGNFKGYEGSELFFQTWPQSKPKAVILGIHGLGEHADSYRLLAEGLQDTGYQLFFSDLRGHGRSAGKRGVGTIDEFVRDIKVFTPLVQAKFPDLPFFFLAHSMGGLVLLKLLIRHGSLGASGAVLSSPLLGVAVEVSGIKKGAAQWLSKLTPNLTMNNEIPPENLTHYKKVIERNETDHWRHDRISPLLYTSMLRNMEYVFNRPDKIQLPLLMQQAGDDLVVSAPKAIELFGHLTMADKELITYDGYYHEIYNEIWREKPIGDLVRWLDRHLKVKS